MSRRFALASLFLVACGGAAAPSAGRAPEAQAPEPTSVEEAQQQIARAKADLTATADTRAEKEPSAAAPGGAGAGATADEAPKKSSTSMGGDSDKGGTSPACQSPCRAIASMRRAVGALCRMTGDADARCSDAKRTLKESELRISSCGC